MKIVLGIVLLFAFAGAVRCAGAVRDATQADRSAAHTAALRTCGRYLSAARTSSDSLAVLQAVVRYRPCADVLP